MWRTVAIPVEHGGWGLTIEPILLGLLVAPSWAGAAVAISALTSFLMRTPLKLALVDHRRGRSLPRTRLAARLALIEFALLIAAATAAVLLSGGRWLLPVACAAPLAAVELWFDVRSRGRRLVPELCGAVGIAAVVAAITIAGGRSLELAIALWFVLAARAIGSIPFVRAQIARIRKLSSRSRVSDIAQLAAAAVAALAVGLTYSVAAGALAVALLGVAQIAWLRRPPVPARTLGVRQMMLGFALVVVTAVGVLVS